MHKNALDVCIQVVKVQYVGPEYTKMKADYINLGYTGNPMTILRMNNFIVDKSQYDNWRFLMGIQMRNPRTKSGFPE